MSKIALTNTPFFLVLNDHSCVGKSTVSDLLFEKYANICSSTQSLKEIVSYIRQHTSPILLV